METHGTEKPPYIAYEEAVFLLDQKGDLTRALEILSTLEIRQDIPDVLRIQVLESVALSHHRLNNHPEALFYYRKALSMQIRQKKINWWTADRVMLAHMALSDSVPLDEIGPRYLQVGELIICLFASLRHSEVETARTICECLLVELDEISDFLIDRTTLRRLPNELHSNIMAILVPVRDKRPQEALRLFETSELLSIYLQWQVNLGNELFTHALHLRRDICRALGTDDLSGIPQVVSRIEREMAPLTTDKDRKIREFASSLMRSLTTLKIDGDAADIRKSFFTFLTDRNESGTMILGMFYIQTKLPPDHRVPVFHILRLSEGAQIACNEGRQPDIATFATALKNLPKEPFSKKEAERVRLNHEDFKYAKEALEKNDFTAAREHFSEIVRRYLYDQL